MATLHIQNSRSRSVVFVDNFHLFYILNIMAFCTPTKPDKEILNIPPSPYLKRLGYGTGVTVYQFDRSPKADKCRSPWALKMINKRNKTTCFGKRLREEAALLKKMNHPHIVGFRAFAKTNLGQECLAMETCEVSLADLIENRSEEVSLAFPAENILRMGHHISKALDYLHVRMNLLHGDIKSHNVLIIRDFEVCKLCDFGVSLPLTKTGELDREKAGPDAEYVGTLCWSAPEIVENSSKVTNKADIFAFGLVVWEMISLDIPHSTDVNEDLVDENDLDNSLRESGQTFGTRPAVPQHMLGGKEKEYNYPLEIFYCCTESNPDDRPTAQHLALSIYEMINSEILN